MSRLWLAFVECNQLIRITWSDMRAGPRFNIKMTSYQYRKSHCGDKTILRPSYPHNGISYTGKTTSLYWIRTLHTTGVPLHGSLARYVKLRVAHAPGMPGTFPLPQHMLWCMSGSLTTDFLWSQWRGKRSRHSRRIRSLQFCVSGKRPTIGQDINSIVQRTKYSHANGGRDP